MYEFLNPDYIVLGEGEITVVELIDQLSNSMDCSNVKGIGYQDKSGEFRLTPSRPPIMDLDKIPFPDLDGFDINTYLGLQQPNDNLYLYIDDNPRFYPIISSRGCPYNCTFCYHPLGQKYRSRSVDNFIEEIEYVINMYDVKNLAIFDELLSNDRKRLFEICMRLKGLSRPVNWMCQLRVDSVDEEMLRVMKDAGCFIVSYGFESANDKVLKSMNKFITAKQIDKALRLARKIGIGVQGYFIFGDPAETKETAYETLDFWEARKDYHITLGYIRPYPGSVLWKSEFKKRDKTFELDFLEKCVIDPPNLSSMSDEEWFELQKDVQKSLLLNDHFGEFISSRREGENRYSITIRCPHCNEVITYNNFNQRILGVFKLVCRSCNQAMNMTPLVFDHVREDYERNLRVFEKIRKENLPVTVTPCMNEAEYQAQYEVMLEGINVVSFLDQNIQKTHRKYRGKEVFQMTKENIQRHCSSNYFAIPLTRFADAIFSELVSLGVSKDRICRLDELTTACPSEDVKQSLLQECRGL
jgi:radical SAM superfamily enzyme YgiQ (UPF0313 family)